MGFHNSTQFSLGRESQGVILWVTVTSSIHSMFLLQQGVAVCTLCMYLAIIRSGGPNR